MASTFANVFKHYDAIKEAIKNDDFRSYSSLLRSLSPSDLRTKSCEFACAPKAHVKYLKLAISLGGKYDKRTMVEACFAGNTACVVHLHKNGCEVTDQALRLAMRKGSVEMFEYLILDAKCPISFEHAVHATINGMPDKLKYILENYPYSEEEYFHLLATVAQHMGYYSGKKEYDDLNKRYIESTDLINFARFNNKTGFLGLVNDENASKKRKLSGLESADDIAKTDEQIIEEWEDLFDVM